MKKRIEETRKIPGVCYAFTDDGVELPVPDVTHGAFLLEPGEEELRQREEAYLEGMRRWEGLPAPLRRGLSWWFRRRSLLARAGTGAEDSLLSGMNTYLMKLGPRNLGAGYATALDRKVADELPPFGVRLRLRDQARLLADALAEVLRTGRAGPVLLWNLAGGTGMDSLNALIRIRKERSELLTGRSVRVLLLDPDESGPRFGSRATEALRGPGGPLEGMDLEVRRVPYDWATPSVLWGLRDREGTPWAVSSEGGLFEYGSDEEILANLEVLKGIAGSGCFLTGSVLRDNEVTRVMGRNSRLAIQCRGMGGFSPLAARAGWEVRRVLDGPTIHSLLLEATGPEEVA